MQESSNTTSKYDPRWFIWTIVFLVATGVSLVSYIMLSNDNSTEYVEFSNSTNKKVQ